MPQAERAEISAARLGWSPDLAAWTFAALIAEVASLRSDDHKHLRYALIRFLWTNVSNPKEGQMVIGKGQRGTPQDSVGTWSRARALLQVTDFYGRVPGLHHHDRRVLVAVRF